MREIPICGRRLKKGSALPSQHQPQPDRTITLAPLAVANIHGVPVSHTGVVTPNHPDMVWLAQKSNAPVDSSAKAA
ncbi:MAG: hypothetical protein NTW03_06510 [Verrucomicrobia bacterium]|nr:hypothetical protein [Verrucomicrobiota bacterium]